jgi:hypothetical protein
MAKKKLGRKTLLSAELQRRICHLLSQGVPVGATCDTVGITQATYHAWIAKGEEGREPYREFVEGTTRARGQARVSLLEKITLSNDWRAHAWLLSHCWPEEFSESRILQPGRRPTRAQKHSKTESSKSRRSFRKFITSTHSAGNWKQKREMQSSNDDS